MAYRDLLLAALTYPDATPDRALRGGVALARRIGGACTLLNMRVDLPEPHSFIANAVMDLDRLAKAEEARSAAAAQHAISIAGTAAAEADIDLQVVTLSTKLYEETDALCAVARTRDLCLASIGQDVLGSRFVAEAVLFGSGRPVMIYPEQMEITSDTRFSKIAVAWDGGARSARAVADALPLLQAAGMVRIIVVTDEKPHVSTGQADDLVRHLQTHGVAATVDEAPARGQSIGHILQTYVATEDVDLLVMGGFGHTRVREFVLGGATQGILEKPPCPVVMSH